MKVVVVGNDGRAAVLTDRLLREGNEVYVVPGSPYTGMPLGPIELTDKDKIVRYVCEMQPDLVIATRIEVSACGIVDSLRGMLFPVFGVSQAHSSMENSKAAGKKVAEDMGLDLPKTKAFKEGCRREAIDWVKQEKKAFTVKPDGITGGKGVVVCHRADETIFTLESDENWNNGPFVLEETIVGAEFSLEFWVSGGEVKPMVLNLEYKRKSAGELGCLTAGMAAVQSNDWIANSPFARQVGEKLERWATANKFVGPVYITFMQDTTDGKFKFLEFNVRLCDPEFELMEGLMEGSLDKFMYGIAMNEPISKLDMPMNKSVAVGICVVAGGYPYKDACLQDVPIMIGSMQLKDDVAWSFDWKPMGVRLGVDRCWYTHGGRQFVACGYNSLDMVFGLLYHMLRLASFMDMEYRIDIECLTVQRIEKLQEVGAI